MTHIIRPFSLFRDRPWLSRVLGCDSRRIDYNSGGRAAADSIVAWRLKTRMMPLGQVEGIGMWSQTFCVRRVGMGESELLIGASH